MDIGHTRCNADPGLHDHLRKTNEAHSAAFYAPFNTIERAIAATLRGFFEVLRRVHRRRKTYRELSRLSDRQLKDIGLSRSEIDGVAQALAGVSPEVGLTIADIRQIWRTTHT